MCVLFLIRILDTQPTQLYTANLSYAISRYRRAPAVSFHLVLVLLVVFSIYAYRDLVPLATFNQQPIDGPEGSIFLVKMTLLFGVSIVVPLCKPRRYVPLDPNVSPLLHSIPYHPSFTPRTRCLSPTMNKSRPQS
jgi:hypothetical protein